MQGIGGIGSDVAVDIVGIAVPAVASVGVREASLCRCRAVVVVAGERDDIARPVVRDTLLGEGVGGGAATVVLPGSQAVCAVVGEGVGLGGLSVLGPGPGGDIAGLLINRRRPTINE